jgi:hypothetical protein
MKRKANRLAVTNERSSMPSSTNTVREAFESKREQDRQDCQDGADRNGSHEIDDVRHTRASIRCPFQTIDVTSATR